MNKILTTTILFLVTTFSANSQISVASIFSDNMVLQRNVKIPVWGLATANDKITVQFHNQTKSTKTDKFGKWNVLLDNEMAGGPYVLLIKNKKNTIEIKNILVGEVWLCSGQSNMEWTVGQSDNAKFEIANANFPNIRHIKIPKAINSVENYNFIGSKWDICSSETVADFTGIGYFYAKELNQKLNVPIGIINASWGGTNIETWISREGYESSEDSSDSEQAKQFKEMIATMPKVNLDDLLKLKLESAKNRIETLQKTKLKTDKIAQYNQLSFDDSSWLELQQPGIWEEQTLGNFDGVVWLRKHFNLTENNKDILLEIPAIDDNDETFVNGTKVGETNGWDTKRSYIIPANLLNIGDNVIAIRVTDNGGGGGIHGNEKALKLILEKTEIPLNGTWKFQVETIKNTVNENEFPSLCYNAMINPLIPFAFKGVLWYQGESNAPRAYQYNKSFPLLINDWRTKWKTNFPFYFVQLASFHAGGDSNKGCSWAELREAQSNTLSVPNTAMVVTTDLVKDPTSIHPTNKQDVGKRLSKIAFNNLYGFPMVCSGPIFKSFENKENQTILTFDNIGSGLMTNDEYGYIKGYEIAGENQVFYAAKAEIIDNKVVLTNSKVKNPIAIRFGWIGNAINCNLYNIEGFPVVPFRTDDWKTSTKDAKYSINKL